MIRALLLGCLLGGGASLRAAPLPSAPSAEPVLALADAIRAALQSNLNIKVQSYNPGIARANALVALGAFDPALTFNRSYAVDDAPTSGVPLIPSKVRTDNYAIALGGLMPWGLNYSIGGTAVNERGTFNGFTNDYVTFGGINITQPLLRGFGLGPNLVNVRVANANRRIADWSFRLTLIQTVTAVVDGYSSLVLAHHQLSIAEHNQQLAQTLLDQNVNEVKIGNAPQSDVTTAKTQVAARQEAILLAQHALLADDNYLRQLMGQRSFPSDQPLLAVAEPQMLEVAIEPAKDFQTALNNRPEYQAARLGITVSRAQYLAARNQLLPQVDLVAGYGYNGINPNFSAARHMVETENYPSSAIGVNVSIPLTDMVGRGAARAAQLTLRQSEDNVTMVEATIAENVANAADEVETARKQVISDRTAYSLASKALDDEMKKFRAGTSSTLAVIQAQGILISAELSVADAMATEFQAVANYDEALGTTLVRYHIDAGSK